MTQKLTLFILLVTFCLIMAYDGYLAFTGQWDATISNSVYQLAKGSPIIPFLVGLAMGHLFWPVAKGDGK